MTKEEIDILWQKAMQESIKNNEMFTRYHFAKLMAERALADPMREVQRLGQEIEPVAWLLTDKNINSLQVDSITRLIDRLNHAHHTDLCVRINGEDEWFQADWLKHLIRVTPQRPWVGLTAEEVLQCWERAHEPGNKEHINAIRMADEVDQALKEKNT